MLISIASGVRQDPVPVAAVQWLETKNNTISNQRKIPPPPTTAILIFSREAGEEAEQKRYADRLNKKAGVQIAASLLKHTIEEAEASLLPVIKCFSHHQKGDSFGERLSNAIEHAFEQGYDQLIVTGSDTPDISADVFQQAAVQLQSNEIVLGPSADGGVYLIGIQKKFFKRELFLDIPWLTSKVCKALQQYSTFANAKVAYQATLEDVDSVRALRRFESIESNWLHTLLAQLFTVIKKRRSLPREFHLTAYSQTTIGLRGPPAIMCLHFA